MRWLCIKDIGTGKIKLKSVRQANAHLALSCYGGDHHLAGARLYSDAFIKCRVIERFSFGMDQKTVARRGNLDSAISNHRPAAAQLIVRQRRPRLDDARGRAANEANTARHTTGREKKTGGGLRHVSLPVLQTARSCTHQSLSDGKPQTALPPVHQY